MGYIRRLEVKGFKSFGAKTTTISFEPGLTTVAGPNGSGKSNIADAILFGLGENSPRILRAAQGRLTGLIYDPKSESREGATEERPAGCRVTLQFDNADRKIPLDSDIVTITRELKRDGESTYFINGKRNPKSIISDLLDVGGLSPSGLNVVPQNAATRVAELSPDEKRKLIEEVVGIAKFDEKKAEAQKQLGQADTKLQIELARTGEMKAQLERLESQRNDLLRFAQLEGQLNWLRAVETSRRIVELRERISSLKRQEAETGEKLDEARRRRADLEAKIASVEGERDKFVIDIIQGGGEGPTALRDEREQARFRFERLTSEAQTKEENVRRLESELIPSLRTIVSEKRKQMTSAQSTVESLLSSEQKVDAKRKEVAGQLEDVRRAEETLRSTVEKKRRQLERISAKLDELSQGLGTIGIESGSLDASLSVESKRLAELSVKSKNFGSVLESLDKSVNALFEVRAKATQELADIDRSLDDVEKRKRSIEGSMGAASAVLERVSTEVAAESVRREVTEELTGDKSGHARLQALCEEGGVPGYVGRLNKLIGYPAQYSKAVGAVLEWWLSAFVVRDVRSMTAMIRTARGLGVKSFAVIPLSEVDGTSAVRVDRSTGVVGPLSSVIRADRQYAGLVNFVAGDTVLVETEAIAYVLASEGYKTVTMGGELFELGARAFALGYHDVIADILEGIENIEDNTEIEGAVQLLRDAMQRRKMQVGSLVDEGDSLNKERVKRIASVAGLRAEVDTIARLSRRYKAIFRSIHSEQVKQERAVDRLSKRTSALWAKKDSLEKGIASLRNARTEIESLELERMLSELDNLRNDLTLQLNEQNARVAEVHLSYTREKADLEQMLTPSYEKDRQDLEVGTITYERDKAFVQDAKRELQPLSKRLAELDEKLQKVLEESANSRPVLEEFESRIRRLKEEKDVTDRTSINLERELYSTQQSEVSTQDRVEQSLSSLRFWGYEDALPVFDGSDNLLTQIQAEYDELARIVNRIAEKEFAAVYDNYRNLSQRINELETERTSIVRFIENIDAEKRKVFVDSFQAINHEFGVIFNTLTGGAASLELEKPEDMFTGGIFMMGSFRGKPAWESSSMSGGEKSVTAVALILAMQKVNPHPFYLFDEIDQNLDQANSSSLAAFLRDRAENSQILVITLKADVVARSHMAYGVYNVGGISRVVHSRLEVEVKNG